MDRAGKKEKAGARAFEGWQNFVAKVEVLALVGVAAILASIASTVLQWFGVPDKTSRLLAVVSGVTLFWMLMIYWLWAFVAGESRRRNQKR